MVRFFTFIKTVLVCGMLLMLISGCSKEDRDLLAQQQIGVVLKFDLCNDCPFQLSDSLTAESVSDLLITSNHKALVEVCFFNDSSKIREYTTTVYRIDSTTWQTDTLRMINPGVGVHTVQRVIIFEDDVEQPLYSAVNTHCNELFKTREANKLPLFIEMGPMEALNRLVTLQLTLFNTGCSEPILFGYDKWCTYSRPVEPLTIVIANSQLTVNPQDVAPRMTGKMVLSQLIQKEGVCKGQKLEEQVFVEEVKTNLPLPNNIRPDALFELSIFIPDEINPQVVIADTLTGKQLKAFRESGFWMKDDPQDPDAGLILFDLSRLPQQSTGIISIADSLHDAASWTPYYFRR